MAHFVAGAALGRWASWYLPWSDENREAFRKANQEVLDHEFSKYFRKGDEAFVLDMRRRSGGANLDAETAALKQRHNNTINSSMSNLRGTNLSGDLAAEDGSRKRGRSSTGTMNRLAIGQLTNAITNIHASVEGGTAARASSASYRLHPGKYVKCDPMLKDMFFPLLTSKLNFGFTSATGLRNSSWNDATANTIEKKSARGLYRGVSFFKLRYTAPAKDRKNPNCLNDMPIKVANTSGIDSSTASDGDVFSMYRRFNSAPRQLRLNTTTGTPAATGSRVTQTEVQDFTDGIVPGNDFAEMDQRIRQLGMGMNLAHLETQAYFSQNFQQTLGNLGSKPIGTSDVDFASNWTGYIPPVSSTETGCVVRGTPGSPYYYQNQKDAVMRIADGQVSMDITNTCRSNERIEIVIHAMKKTDIETNTPELYEAIYESVEYAQKAKANNNLLPTTEGDGADETTKTGVPNTPGGWQAFYDPDYPLLKTSSKHDKKVKEIAVEVHRSIHVLAPGQSKNIKIALGSLYYSLGNKSESRVVGGDAFIYSKEDNTGTLAVCVAHTGFKALETMATTDSTLNSSFNPTSGTSFDPTKVGYAGSILGGGFFAGRSFAPSSITVSGNYLEKYYPLYFNSTQRLFGNFGVYSPSFFGGSKNTLPLINIPQEVVATTPAHNAGVPVGTANKTQSV
jgi:hypothetical protein